MYDEFTVTEFLRDQLGIIPKLTDDVNRFSPFRKQLRNILDVSPNAAGWGRRIFTANDEVFHLRGLHFADFVPHLQCRTDADNTFSVVAIH